MPRLHIRFSLFKVCLAVFAQPGVMAAGAPQAAANGASQPGGSPWQGSVFLSQTLPLNFERLRRECPHLHLATSVGQAVDMAHGFQEYLPLPVEALVDFDILEALDCIGGAGQPAETSVEAVVAESIPRISDINRPPSYKRIDFFLYCSNGDVIRHHPRRTARSSMHPHRMPFGSALFSLTHAMGLGVGASLHWHPPAPAPDAGAPQPGVVLCCRRDVDESCPYDVQMWSWPRVRAILHQQSRVEEGQVDISDGHLLPWWLLLGGTNRHRQLLDRGVTHVVASGCNLVVTVLDGEVIL